MKEINEFLTRTIISVLSIILGVILGFMLAKRHYEPLLKACEQNQKHWEETYRDLKTVERRFDLLTAKIELEEAKRRASVIWNQGVIYPSEAD